MPFTGTTPERPRPRYANLKRPVSVEYPSGGQAPRRAREGSARYLSPSEGTLRPVSSPPLIRSRSMTQNRTPRTPWTRGDAHETTMPLDTDEGAGADTDEDGRGNARIEIPVALQECEGEATLQQSQSPIFSCFFLGDLRQPCIGQTGGVRTPRVTVWAEEKDNHWGPRGQAR